jgi:hypothetical protein
MYSGLSGLLRFGQHKVEEKKPIVCFELLSTKPALSSSIAKFERLFHPLLINHGYGSEE